MDPSRGAWKDHSVYRTGKEISMSTETPRLEKASGASRPVENVRA
jgi:hypothetical protein